MNKVYLVMEHYWDDEHRSGEYNSIRAFGSKEEAEEFINSMPIPVKKVHHDNYEESPIVNEWVEIENGCWKKPDDDLYDDYWWQKEEGVIRVFALGYEYTCIDKDVWEDWQIYTYDYYVYYISELPFGKEKEDDQKY